MTDVATTFNPSDVEQAEAATEDTLKKIVDYANLQIALEDEVAALEEQLADKKKALAVVSERDLPNALIAAGIKGLPLVDGSKVELREIIRAGIKTEDNPNKAKSFAYLRSIDWGDLIKTEFKVLFGKGEEQTAARFADTVHKDFPNQEMDEKESVNAQTLSASVREHISMQDELPPESQMALDEELLGIYRQRFTKIVAPKKKKGGF